VKSSNTLRRPRLLILAYACSPLRGSESGVGWNRAVEAAKDFDVWVICEEREFRQDIESYLEKIGPIENLHFAYVPMPRREWAFGQAADALWYWMLKRWHRRALRTARKLDEEVGFDVVHQLTFCGYREPGYLWKLDAPFVWGPIGGTQNYPWRFLQYAGCRGAAFEIARNIVNSCQLRFDRRVRNALRKASAVLAASSSIRADLLSMAKVPATVISDVGVARIEGNPRRPRNAEEPLRILWSGILKPRKALPLLIEALAILPPDLAYEVRILGDGPCRRSWNCMATRRGVATNVKWLGWLPHEEALRQYAWADVFVFTSLRDTTGTVLPEALAAGLPVICLDHQGGRDVVTAECGAKIPVTTPRQVIERLSEAIAHLATHPEVCQRMSREALRRAEDYLWTKQGEKMTAVYQQVLEETGQAKDARGRPPLRAPHFLASCAALPAHKFFGNRLEDAFGVLMYHRVASCPNGISKPTWNVTPKNFRRQMEGLLRTGYRPWPLRKASEYHCQGRKIPRDVFVVTFDDGYENFYTEAWPILKELSIPATVFPVTGYLGTEAPMPFEDWPAAGSAEVPVSAWKSLTRAQCDEMLAGGLVEIGTHTHAHEDYRGRAEAFRRDLERSLTTLQRWFGIENPPFAYPYGYAEDFMKEAARSCGVECALTAEKRLVTPADDIFAWGRFPVENYDSASLLATKLSGWYSLILGSCRWLARSLKCNEYLSR
jgi:glycosyltransferase involved in cell wall biosynthesis/peptidoglycan/xylan/chitin deacetylase (PgdA/CDA1 family)